MTWFTTTLIGVGLIGLAAFLAHREHRWLKQASIVEGEVIELVQSRGSKGGFVYAPRVRFLALDGSPHEFTRSHSSYPAGFFVGERVLVAYDVPSFEARVLTFGQRYGLATTLATIGTGLVLMAAVFTVGQRVIPKIYLPGL